MSRAHTLTKMTGWVSWSHHDDGEYSLGRVGFSYKRDEYRADIFPQQGTRKTLTQWVGVIWKGNDRDDILAEVRGPHHWAAASEVMAAIDRLQLEGKRGKRR